MKNYIQKLLVLSLSCAAFGCSMHKAEPKAAPAMPSQKEMMSMMKEYATPGEAHKRLNVLVGQWNHNVQMWMDPKSPPQTSKGHSNIHWIMGGRFLEHTVTGKSMGMPFEGKALTGYDNKLKQYQTVWIDNMGTGMMVGTGSFDTAKQSLTDNGTFSCPMYGTVQYRAVTTLVDKNHFSYEMFMSHSDMPETKIMAIEYTRAKK